MRSKIDAQAPLTLRAATLKDMELLRRWDQQPHVVAAAADGAWGGEEELARPPPNTHQLIASIDGRPVGLVQILDPAQDTPYWGESAHSPGSLRAIDIWIGEPDALRRGYGTQMMRQALALCFAQPEVTAVLADPLTRNTQARRFFERLGFELMERRSFGEDDCCVYRLARSALTLR